MSFLAVFQNFATAVEFPRPPHKELLETHRSPERLLVLELFQQTLTQMVYCSDLLFMLCVSNRSMFTHSIVDGSPIGGLHQHFVACCCDFLHMLRGKRCPSLPHVNVLSSDSHHALMMTRPPLAAHTAFHPPALASNKSQHGSPRLHGKVLTAQVQ